MTRVDLSTKAIVEQRRVKRQLRSDFDRFRDAVGKEGCAVLLVSKGHYCPVMISRKRGKMSFLKLDERIKERARKVVESENRKLAEKGVTGQWIDGEKLAVQRVDFITSEFFVDIQVRKILYSQILAMKDEPFEAVNRAGMRKLDTNTHIIATEKAGNRKFEVLLVAGRGRGLDNPRMGEMLCAGPEGKEQLTLAIDGMVDADLLKYYPPDEIIARNSLREIGEELNMNGIGHERVLFEGLMVDTYLFTGAFGVVTTLHVPFTVDEISRMRNGAEDGKEIGEIYPIENTGRAVAAFLKEKRESCLPQLVSGLVIYGYNRWGSDFLEEAAGL